MKSRDNSKSNLKFFRVKFFLILLFLCGGWINAVAAPTIFADIVAALKDPTLFPSGYTCEKTFDGSDPGTWGTYPYSDCYSDYSTLDTHPTGRHFKFTGSPVVSDLFFGTAADYPLLKEPYPTNAWFEQAFWNKYRKFPNDETAALHGNRNCVGANWNACHVYHPEGSLDYNQPIVVAPLPLGTAFNHPSSWDDNAVTMIGSLGLKIYGPQRSFFYYNDPAWIKSGRVLASFQSMNYSDITVRPAGNLATVLFGGTCSQVSLTMHTAQYSCSAEWTGQNILVGNHIFQAEANVQINGVSYTGTSLPVTQHVSEITANVSGNSSVSVNNAASVNQSSTGTSVGTKVGVDPTVTPTSIQFNPATSADLKATWLVNVIDNNHDLTQPGVFTFHGSTISELPYYKFNISDANNPAKPNSMTTIVPDKIGAWSVHFKMPFSIGTTDNYLGFNLVEGSPLMQFDVPNGVVPVTSITPNPAEGQPAHINWIFGGPQGATPTSNLYGFFTGSIGGTFSGETVNYPMAVFAVTTGNHADGTGKPVISSTTNYYALYVPPGSTWARGVVTNSLNTKTFNEDALALQLGGSPDAKGNRYFVLARLPNVTTDAGASAAAKLLAKYAFNYVDTTTVHYNVENHGIVETEFKAKLLNNGVPVVALDSGIGQISNQAVFGLFPHQYLQIPNQIVVLPFPANVNYIFGNDGYCDSPLGKIKPFVASDNTNTFQVDYQYPGILPYMPPVNATTDANGATQQEKYFQQSIGVSSSHIYFVQSTSTSTQYEIAAKDSNNNCLKVLKFTSNPSATAATVEDCPAKSNHNIKINSDVTWYPGVGCKAAGSNTNCYFLDNIFQNGHIIAGVSYNKIQGEGDINKINYNGGYDKANPSFSNYLVKEQNGGYDTYYGGKQMHRLVQMAEIAKQKNSTYAAEIFAAASDMFAHYFTGNYSIIKKYSQSYDGSQGTYSNKVFYAFPMYLFGFEKGFGGSLIGFPSAFGSASNLNDHIFHYGYWVSSAAHLALNPTLIPGGWTTAYKDIVNALINDYAPQEDTPNSGNFSGGKINGDNTISYELRSWDPYMGHAWASGADTSNMGPNLESTSEQINAYIGMILWGAAINDQDMVKKGIYLYTTAIHSAWSYWYGQGDGVFTRPGTPLVEPNYLYDNFNDIGSGTGLDDPNFKGFAGGVNQTAMKMQLFFVPNGFSDVGINTLPVTAGSFYLGMYPGQVDSDYKAARGVLLNKTFNNTHEWQANGVDSTWQGIMAEYVSLGSRNAMAALFNPDGSTNSYYWGPDENICSPAMATYPDNEGVCLDNGDSRIHAYTFMRSLNNYGAPQFNYYATDSDGNLWPTFAVFVPAAGSSAAAASLAAAVYNPTANPLDIIVHGPDHSITCKNVPAHTLQMCSEQVTIATPIINDAQPNSDTAILYWTELGYQAGYTFKAQKTDDTPLNLINVHCSGTNCTGTLTSLIPGTTYSVQLQAISGGQSSAWSAAKSFTTLLLPPPSNLHFTPAKGLPSGALSWSPASFAGDKLYYAQVGGTQYKSGINATSMNVGLPGAYKLTDITMWTVDVASGKTSTTVTLPGVCAPAFPGKCVPK